MSDDIDTAVALIWDYMQLNQPVEPADAMIVLGSRDDRVATCAAGLLKASIAPHSVVTGGLAHNNDLLESTWAEATEAEHFASIMKAAGVSQKLIIEDYATNTGENAIYSYRALHDAGIDLHSLLLVTKPYMERRALATFEKQWPDKTVSFRVTSQGGSIEQYLNENEDYTATVNIMVGDLHRIIKYPKLEFQTTQPVTKALLHAFETLCSAGFTQHLLP